jgi:hypothetical protein
VLGDALTFAIGFMGAALLLVIALHTYAWWTIRNIDEPE